MMVGFVVGMRGNWCRSRAGRRGELRVWFMWDGWGGRVC